MGFLDRSPSPFHVVETVRQRLTHAGFTELSPAEQWHIGTPDAPTGGQHEAASAGFVCRDGSVIAWRVGNAVGADFSFRLVGAHTDSPNLRVAPHPDVHRHGFHQLHIEVYGGILRNSWLDRDLALAGRVVDEGGRSVLFNTERPIARIPQLAVHLDRGVNDGLTLNPQDHLRPIWSIDNPGGFRSWLAEQTDLDRPVGWDLGFYDHQPAAIIGADESMLVSGRLDNQVSCWAATTALIDAQPVDHVAVIVLNDHEEVGSVATTGADGRWLDQVLERLAATVGVSRERYLAALAGSFMVSADNAHGIHPNYPERHEPRHAPQLNGGPVIKTNVNQRYATTATTAARFAAVCTDAGIEYQTFASKNTMPCGSTIGPMSAAQLSVDVVDVGIPQLSMHSAREMCGTADPIALCTVLTRILGP